MTCVVNHRHITTKLRHKFHIATCLEKEFRKRLQPNRHADGIALDILLGAWNRLKMIVHLANDRAFNLFCAVGIFDGVLGHHRYLSTSKLVGMHLITADFRCGFNHRCHIHTGLHELIAHNEANVPAADHQHIFRRNNPFHVHQGLYCTGTINPRQVVIWKDEILFKCPGSNDNAFCFYPFNHAIFVYHHHTVLIETGCNGIGPQGNLWHALNLCGQVNGNLYAAGSCILLFGAKEFVGLLNELATKVTVTFKHQNLYAGFCRFNRRTHSGRATTDDEELGFHQFTFVAELGFDMHIHFGLHIAYLTFNSNTFAQWFYAYSHIRNPIYLHKARRAITYRTEQASVAMLFFRLMQGAHPGCMQCCRNGFPFVAF